MYDPFSKPDHYSVVLSNLPTSIKGFVYLDSDGNPVIVLNANLTREQNRRTYEHEKKHIASGDMINPNYIEYESDEE